MTNRQIPTVLDPSPLAASDPRLALAHAMATAGATIAGVQPDQFELPTPCSAYDVRQLIGHLVAVARRIAVVGAGGEPFGVPQIAELDDDRVVAAWTDAAHDVQRVWTPDEVLDTMLTVPWAQLPGHVVARMYTGEISVHTWDLATATGQSPVWHEPALAMAYEAIRIGLPAAGRTAEVEAVLEQLDAGTREAVAAGGAPFGEVVVVGDDAPLIDRLVAWTGRDPRR